MKTARAMAGGVTMMMRATCYSLGCRSAYVRNARTHH